MNEDDSEQSSSCAVKSKYFTSKSAMDESLSDFQETKKSCAGPKNTVKSKSSKPRKALKKIRGQKDIRKVLQSKTNELESYSKDFDKVCKKAGIDIDSEQLQLAIAISKSLQNPASASNEISGNSQPINSKERIGKIRTTLLEYGFKVPEVKITGNTRKIKKHRKNYKLISTSDIEKKEIIANKYSHVLFNNLSQCSLFCSNSESSDIPLYYLASNSTYDTLKITDTFYVKNLVEKSTNSTGSLLRDWSEIPGRPVSPKLLQHINMNFSEIECSQEELDIVLSGTLKNCKNVMSKKTKELQNDIAVRIVEEEGVNNLSVENNKYTGEINVSNHEKNLKMDYNSTNNLMQTCLATTQYRSCSPDIFDDDASYICTIFNNNKSLSVPSKENLLSTHKTAIKVELETDISECVSNKNYTPHYSDSEKPKTFMFLDVTKRKSNDLMELTECIQIQSRDDCSIVEQPQLQLSQNINVTKRRSNDYMEITECVFTLSQHKEKNIDLTQKLDISEKKRVRNRISQGECSKTNLTPKKSTNQIETKDHKIDLTVSLDSNISNVDSNNEIIKEVNPEKTIEIMDLTPSSNNSDDLPFVSLTTAKDNYLGDTIIVDANDYADINKKISLINQAEEHIDLTQHSESIIKRNTLSQSFFEEYNHDHSSNTEESRKNNSSYSDNQQSEPDKIDLTQNVERKSYSDKKNRSQSYLDHVEPSRSSIKIPTPTKTKHTIIEEPVLVDLHSSNFGYKYCEPGKVDLTLNSVEQYDNNEINDNIDLTQNSNTSEDLSQTIDNDEVTEKNEVPADKKSQRYSSLGKQDNVSIDYDDFLNVKDNNENSCSKNTSSKSVIYDIADENDEKHSRNNSLPSNSSQNSEVFDISDKELDYSLHQSKFEIQAGNFSFGGISIMDELSNLRTSKKSIDVDCTTTANNLYGVVRESLPTISTKKNQNCNRCKEISPIKHRRITEIATPQKACSNNVVTVVTPQNSEYIIKTNHVTPMKDYESMSTHDIHKELDKYGIKPFKRKRAIQLLTHIYNQTHPIIETYSDDLASPPKRHKPNDQTTVSPKKCISPRRLLISPQKDSEFEEDIVNITRQEVCETGKAKENSGTKTRKGKGKGKSTLENRKKNVPERLKDNVENEECGSRSKHMIVQRTDESSIGRDIECKPEDWVFQKREKAKVHSCRVPLHIAFHNYVSSRRELREAILCYQPVEIDIIHKDLVGYGHRYDPKDLLKFLDKKCVTVKTMDNEARNQK